MKRNKKSLLFSTCNMYYEYMRILRIRYYNAVSLFIFYFFFFLRMCVLIFFIFICALSIFAMFPFFTLVISIALLQQITCTITKTTWITCKIFQNVNGKCRNDHVKEKKNTKTLCWISKKSCGNIKKKS